MTCEKKQGLASPSHQRLTFQSLSPNVRMFQSQGWAPGGLCLGTEGNVWVCMCSVQTQWEGAQASLPAVLLAFRAGGIRQISSSLCAYWKLLPTDALSPVPVLAELAWLKPSCFCMAVPSVTQTWAPGCQGHSQFDHIT